MPRSALALALAHPALGSRLVSSAPTRHSSGLTVVAVSHDQHAGGHQLITRVGGRPGIPGPGLDSDLGEDASHPVTGLRRSAARRLPVERCHRCLVP
jgi:hypothetical protein